MSLLVVFDEEGRLLETVSEYHEIARRLSSKRFLPSAPNRGLGLIGWW